MSDRGFLFLFSLLMIACGIGAAAYLVATGQAATVDGLFMVLTALLTAAVFGLYVKFMIGRAMEQAEAAKPAPKAAAKETPAKAAPVQG
jgi:membrane protein DedA with SNARE-associated domain